MQLTNTTLTYKYNITDKHGQLRVKQLLFATETYIALLTGHKQHFAMVGVRQRAGSGGSVGEAAEVGGWRS